MYQDRIKTINMQTYLIILCILVEQHLSFYLLGEQHTMKHGGAAMNC